MVTSMLIWLLAFYLTYFGSSLGFTLYAIVWLCLNLCLHFAFDLLDLRFHHRIQFFDI